MPEKFILDATAGYRMMWFNKHEPHTIYLDQRPECEPDIVGDFRDLNQFPDKTFRFIIFDPPHFVKHNPAPYFKERYGCLQPETWQNDLRQGLAECWRVLQDYGILLFKWNTQNKSKRQIIRLLPTEPLLYQITRNSAIRPSETAQTLWFCFMKIPAKEVKP